MLVQHPTLTFKGFQGTEPCYCVKCSFCGRLAPVGNDMHQAVEKAYSAAYSTIPGTTRVDPRRWSCPGCTSKRSA